MFYFYADITGKLESKKGVVMLRSKRMFANLAAAARLKPRRILAIDTSAVPGTENDVRSTDENIKQAMSELLPRDIPIPVSSIRNLKPYYPPDEVLAGGGVVTKMKKGSLRVLVIYRKGVWDLPKGKMDKGESIETCARREVMEETGIKHLEIVQRLDFTLHGYVRNRRFKVKNTSWYEMHTTSKKFKPQKSEGIEEVRWMKWEKAERKIGYRMLRDLLARTRHLVERTAESEIL